MRGVHLEHRREQRDLQRRCQRQHAPIFQRRADLIAGRVPPDSANESTLVGEAAVAQGQVSPETAIAGRASPEAANVAAPIGEAVVAQVPLPPRRALRLCSSRPTSPRLAPRPAFPRPASPRPASPRLAPLHPRPASPAHVPPRRASRLCTHVSKLLLPRLTASHATSRQGTWFRHGPGSSVSWVILRLGAGRGALPR